MNLLSKSESQGLAVLVAILSPATALAVVGGTICALAGLLPLAFYLPFDLLAMVATFWAHRRGGFGTATVLLAIMLVVGLPAVSTAGSPHNTGSKEATHSPVAVVGYEVEPVELPGGVYFVDLLDLQNQWLREVSDRVEQRGQRQWIKDHFDLLLAGAIANWRAELNKSGKDIRSMTAVARTPQGPVPDTHVSPTTGLIIITGGLIQ